MVEVELNPEAEEFKKSELLGKYTARILFGWDNKKFEDEYLKKLERNWARWKEKEIGEREASSSRVGILKEGVMVCLNTNIFLFLLSIFLDLIFLLILFLFLFLMIKRHMTEVI